MNHRLSRSRRRWFGGDVKRGGTVRKSKKEAVRHGRIKATAEQIKTAQGKEESLSGGEGRVGSNGRVTADLGEPFVLLRL